MYFNIRVETLKMSKQQNKMELAEKTAGSNYTLNNGFLGGKEQLKQVSAS